MSYENATNMIGNCKLCRDRSELRNSEHGAICNACHEKMKNPKPVQTPNNGTSEHHTEDAFPFHKGSYINLNGKRYELNLVSKVRCKHKVLDWLNAGPIQYPFCPICGAQVIFDERTATSEEGHSMAEDQGTQYRLSESARPCDAEERLAGLHGSDDGNPVGDRVKTPKRKREVKQITEPLATPISDSRKLDSDSAKS